MRAVLIGAENVIVAKRDLIVSGPIISGDLRPERESVLRAQLGGSMIEVLVKEGQPVRQGMVLGRIEARTLEDTRRSVESAARFAESQLQVAQREAERTSQLVTAGALAARELDLARNTVTSAAACTVSFRVITQLAESSPGWVSLRFLIFLLGTLLALWKSARGRSENITDPSRGLVAWLCCGVRGSIRLPLFYMKNRFNSDFFKCCGK